MKALSLILLSAAFLAGCGALPPDNSDAIRITRTIPSGG